LNEIFIKLLGICLFDLLASIRD